MDRRHFLNALSLTTAALGLSATGAAVANPTRWPGVGGGDRITGASFASRSPVWGRDGAAATAHPLATLMALDTLRAGGSAVDAAIVANAALGFLEPVGCGIGGDAFALLWDPKTRKVVGLNGSGRSPAGLSLETQRARAKNGLIPRFGTISVTVPGAVDAWWTLHQRYGKLPWARLFEPVAALAERGTPVAQTIAFYLERNMRSLGRPEAGVEEFDNAKRTYAPSGRTAREGEIFANPDLGRTYRLIGQGGRDAFYDGPIAETIERYFRRIGGFMTRADLAAHRAEWTTPLETTYRGVKVQGLGPNSQGLSTLQILNIVEQFDLKAMGFQSAEALHVMAEAKRLAFEDRARWFSDPAFTQIPVETLLSKDYAKRQAALIRPDRVMERPSLPDAPHHGDTTYLTCADADGMMISLIQSNFRGMGSGLVPDGLGFMFQNRGEQFSLKDGHPNLYAPRKRPFQTIIPGFATKDDLPWMSFGVMGGGMQPQGQAQIIINRVDYGLNLQEAGDAPRWIHEGSPEPTGEAGKGTGTLHLESGVPHTARDGLKAKGWTLGEPNGAFGGYQAIERAEGGYAAASEMRKDGLALAY
mgnify:CR=1 FL=1